MSHTAGAVFLSYASQDAEAARSICEALRRAGVEVWFDQSELRGGDAWDRQIRNQIHECALFVPIISATTQGRREGYFRREWRLAVDRTHDMSERVAFLVPVVIDATEEARADVPEAFRSVQWTRLLEGRTNPAFVTRIGQLLSPTEPVAAAPSPDTRAADAAHAAPAVAKTTRGRGLALLIGALALLGIGYYLLDRFVLARHAAAAANAPGVSGIPERSIAVLPFVNMSSDKEQEYFSDGLTEEMIELLGQVPDLRVPARTSSFYFKGKNEPVASIAQQLKVANVLEGSVRKSGKRLRITAQLVRADNGYQLWSQTYDRDDADVFAVQDDIAKAVVGALKIKLAPGEHVAATHGTSDPEAYNQYLLGRVLARRGTLEGYRQAHEALTKAIQLDPNYPAAYASLAVSESMLADLEGSTSGLEQGVRDAGKAIELAPNEADGYSARGLLRSNWLFDWGGARADFEKALSLDPQDGDVQGYYASFLSSTGRIPEALAASKRATELDPLSPSSWDGLGVIYAAMGDYAAAGAAFDRALQLEPANGYVMINLGVLQLLEGKSEAALETFRKVDLGPFQNTGVAMAEYSLGHTRESQAALDDVQARYSKEAAYQIAEIFAWRGEKDKAFEWLERAYAQKDGGLSSLMLDPLLKSLHGDPRFTALRDKMKLPDK
jgi:TolB-like protein/Flp pilus assembly protein TadD